MMLLTETSGMGVIMENITAEQAIEEARGMTFEKMWALMMEDRKRAEEDRKHTEEGRKRAEEERKELDRRFDERMEESRKEFDKRVKETDRQIQETYNKTDKMIKRLSKEIGGVSRTIGGFNENMFSANLWKKFARLGFPVTKQSCNVEFHDGEKKIAEVDVQIENGEYVILVEAKTKLSMEHVDRHLKRIEIVRGYFDAHGDKRKITGAVASAVVDKNTIDYAIEKGLFAIVPSGKSVTIADFPEGFKAREWV